MSTARDWKPYKVYGPANVLVFSDVHIPYADARAVRTMFGWVKGQRISHVLLNGDIADFYGVSRWETNPLERNFPEEIRKVRKFLASVREKFPKAKIIYKLGNHEERYQKFLWQKAPEFLGLDDVSLPRLLRCDDLDITTIQDKRPILLGRLLTAVHGHEYVFQISNPVNAARGLFLRAKSHVIGGHFHQSSQHTERAITQKVIGAWSVGCLCDLHPEYRPLNNWNHGFAMVQITKTGGFTVQNYTIIDGKVL